MEETLGKRIIANRKRVGLTQDKLAEQLGITAQAVSKWENDQSCPDITMLPRLADIFGITTDGLLGVSRTLAVQEAEEGMPSPEAAEDAPSPVSGNFTMGNHNGKWEFKWDGGQKSNIALALWVLTVGGLLLASNFLHWDVGFWGIAWPSGLLIFGLFPRFSFFRLSCALFGGYFLLYNLIPGWFVLSKADLLPIFLLLFGASLLVKALRHKKNPTFKVYRNGEHIYTKEGDLGIRQTKRRYTEDGEIFDCDVSFSSDRQLIRMPQLSGGKACVSFGELEVDLSGCQELGESCRIEADCSFGQLTVYVPSRWRVEAATDTAFGSVEISGQPAAEPLGVIHMDCSASFGTIRICYI